MATLSQHQTGALDAYEALQKSHPELFRGRVARPLVLDRDALAVRRPRCERGGIAANRESRGRQGTEVGPEIGVTANLPRLAEARSFKGECRPAVNVEHEDVGLAGQ